MIDAGSDPRQATFRPSSAWHGPSSSTTSHSGKAVPGALWSPRPPYWPEDDLTRAICWPAPGISHRPAAVAAAGGPVRRRILPEAARRCRRGPRRRPGLSHSSSSTAAAGAHAVRVLLVGTTPPGCSGSANAGAVDPRLGRARGPRGAGPRRVRPRRRRCRDVLDVLRARASCTRSGEASDCFAGSTAAAATVSTSSCRWPRSRLEAPCTVRSIRHPNAWRRPPDFSPWRTDASPSRQPGHHQSRQRGYGISGPLHGPRCPAPGLDAADLERGRLVTSAEPKPRCEPSLRASKG